MKKLFSLLLVGILQFATAAADNLIFRTLDVKSGLSDNFVKDIIRDQYGFIWFSTSNGVCRYDGYQIRQYSVKQLGDETNDILRVVEDGAGTLWIQTLYHIYTYDRETDRLTDDAEERLGRLGISDRVNNLYADDQKNLWVVTNRHLYRYDFKKNSLVKISLQGGTEIVSLTARGHTAYALSKTGGFYQVDIEHKCLRYENHVEMSASDWHSIYLDTKGAIWFYVPHSPSDGLRCFVPSTGRWVDFPVFDRLKNVILTSLIDDGKGGIWIGTENEGVFLFDIRSQTLQQLQRNDDIPKSLPSNHIACFFKDSQDVMWIGTSKRGVAYLDMSPRIFDITRMEKSEDVSCIAEDTRRNKWIGLDGDGIVKIATDGSYTYYNKENGGLPTNLVTCSMIDHTDKLWIGTYGKGIMSFEGNRFVQKHEKGPEIRYLRCMTEDEQGNLWLGTIDNGVVCHRADGQTDWMTLGNSDLRTGSITSLTGNHEGKMYIGTTTGFYIYDIAKRRFSNEREVTRLLADDFVTSIVRDHRGLVWIGTRVGLKIYDEIHNRLYSLTTDDGLSNQYVRAIIVDKSENVWVGTDRGLTFIKANKNTQGKYEFVCSPFFDEEGLEDVVFNYDATCLTTAGDCLIGSGNGFLSIRSGRQVDTPAQVNVLFTGLTVKGRQIEPGDDTGILKKNLLLTETISLSYDQSTFSVDVSAMTYSRIHKLHYLYRLREVNDKWIPMTSHRISFNTLTSGTYTLEVKASDLGGWSSEPAVLKICVKPPFWKSWPAYALYCLLAVLAVCFYMKRSNQKQKEKLTLQKLELELEQQHEMEEKKLQFFTNISHDLKTPLSLIITPLEKILSEPLEDTLKTEINLVWRNARLLMDEVNQLLDLRRLDEGAEELRLSHGDVIPFFNKIIESFRYYAKDRNIQLTSRIDIPTLEMDFDKNKMRRVLMNLLSNAFKYNAAKGAVNVTIGTASENGGQVMRLEVADTGIGISDSKKSRIFDRFYQEEHDTEYVGNGIGLHIVKEYVTLHQGRIRVEDNHPQGSKFIVTIPLQIAESGEKILDSATNRSSQVASRLDYEETTILVVEDNRDFCMFIERCLNDEYKILTASNGIEALNVLKENDVNIVISDIMMPEMDGLQLCHHIKTDINLSHIPVILLTAKSTEQNIIDGLRDGADDYITKPFNLNILKLRINKILEWARNNHQRFSKSSDIAPSEITVSSLDEELITKAIRLVEENMSNSDFSVEDFSAAVGMTRGHLYKKLMAITGKSPIEFIRTIRIKRGRSLLEQGRTNISEVAYTIGFSPKQFSKYFKEEYGCLPSEFLQRN